jgi:hypothetical protein
MSAVGVEPAVSAGEWPQTYALDRVATGTGSENLVTPEISPSGDFVQLIFILV